MKKSAAILHVNEHCDTTLLRNQNTCFSNINKSKEVWWFNIPPKKFSKELHLLLKSETQLIWLKIPANSFSELKKTFKYRKDKEAIDLEISSNKSSHYLQDIKSRAEGYDFKQYIEQEFTFNS